MPGIGSQSGGAINLANPVNRAAPLNRGKTAWLLAIGNPFSGTSRFLDLISQSHGILTGSPTWSNTRPGGRGIISCPAVTDYLNTLGVLDNLTTLTDATFGIWQRKRDATLRASSAIGSTEGASIVGYRINAHLPYSDGTVYFDFGGNTSGVNRIAISGLSFDTLWHRWIFSVGGGLGMRVYRDGVLVGSNAATPARTAIATNSMQVNQFLGGTTTGDVADYDDFCIWNRALSASEVAMDYFASRTGYLNELNWIRRGVGYQPAGGATTRLLSTRRKRMLAA